MTAAEHIVAVDWGTTRLRAMLVGSASQVVDRISADMGIQSVAPGGFPGALQMACGSWFAAQPDLPVIMAGMIGSRNGWVEAPYAPPPCGAADLAERAIAIPAQPREILIIPGVDCRSADGGYDVMRGEETQAIGAGVRNGVICLPGTHSKWVEVEDGRITRFMTFITGELFAALTQSFIGRLAETPDDPHAGDAILSVLHDLPGGLTRRLFQARTQVLDGRMPGSAVRPFLSGLLVDEEVRGARASFGTERPVHLVAADPQLSIYAASLKRNGFSTLVVDPEVATLNGLLAVASLRGLYDDRTGASA